MNHTGRRNGWGLRPAGWLLLILLAGAAVRALYLAELPRHPDFAWPELDALYHDYWARALVSGDWTPPPGQPDPEINRHPYVRAPGYPYFLALLYALFGVHPLVPRIAQMLLGLANAALAYRWGRRAFGAGTGLVFAALMAGYWVLVYYEGELLEPTLSLTVVLLMLDVMSRWADGLNGAHGLAAGLLLGALALLRPNALLFVPVAAGWGMAVALRRRQRLRSAVLALAWFAAGVALPVGTAAWRNYRVAGDPAPVTTAGGLNFYLGYNEWSDGYSGIAPDIRNWSSFDHPRLVRELSAQVGRPLDDRGASAVWMRRALAYIRSQPARALDLTLRRLLLTWGPREISVEKEDELERAASPVLRRLPGGFGALLTLALLGLGFLYLAAAPPDGSRPRPEVPSLIVCFVATYAASFLPFTVTGRYRVPLLPSLMLLGAYGVVQAAVLARRRAWAALAIWAAAAAGVGVLAAANPTDYRPNPVKWHFARGLAWGRAGALDAAAAELREAVRLNPRLASARLNLGIVMAQAGDLDGALAQVREAAALEPAYLTQKNLGILLTRKGDPAGAAKAFAEAARLWPTSVEACVDAAGSLCRTGDYAGAARWYEAALRLRPEGTQTRLDLARVQLYAGQPRAAVDQLHRLLATEPDHAEALNMLAWLRATHPRSDLRDAAEAVALAEHASRQAGLNPAGVRHTLAMAYAEAGRFEDALAQLRLVREGVQAAGNTSDILRIDRQIEQFKRGEAYREDPAPPPAW